MDEKINPGKGYRLLDHGELIRSGDEYKQFDGAWTKTGDAGKQVPKDTLLTYRRKVETPAKPPKRQSPGRGYAWVKKGETTQKGDETCVNGVWIRISASIGWVVPRDYEFRRKIGKPKPADMTKPAKPAKPEPAKPRWDVNIGNAHQWSRVTELKCSVSGNFTQVQFTTAAGEHVNVVTAATVVTTERAAPSAG